MKIRIYIRIVHPSFAPIFHPTFLSVSHAGKASMAGSVSGSLTILRPMLRAWRTGLSRKSESGLDRTVEAMWQIEDEE